MNILFHPHWSAQQTEAHAKRVEVAAWHDPPTGAMRPAWRKAIAAAALVPPTTGAFAQPPVYLGRAYYSAQEWQMYETERTGNP
jgi:hypothetical protein